MFVPEKNLCILIIESVCTLAVFRQETECHLPMFAPRNIADI